VIHAVSVAAVVATGLYLVWRAAFTIDLSFWWVAIPLLLLELHNALGLAMFTVALWDVDAGPEPRPRDRTSMRIAVLIPTYDEPETVLLPTIAAAVALEPAHETWVLDDGRRTQIARLAQELGARYLTRPDRAHAKAGNLNHALETIDADLVAVLDADHIARRDFLRNTLGYFDDPEIALVQTPQDFYNLDSFEHQVRGGAKLFNEQSVFYRVIAAAKNRWRAAFWCGTGAVLRVEALRSVGGVATGTVTEDIHTTMRLHRAGWKTIYHNEVLARGIAARTAREYMLQRHRWATGAMQVLRRERPLTGPGLTAGQRLGYATTLWGWFDAWRSFGYIVLPIAVIATGAVPIDAPLSVFGPLFLGVLTVQFVALRLLARGHYPPLLSILFEFLRMPAVLSGTLALFRDRPRSFSVTPKGRADDEHARATVPALTIVLLLATVAALAWFALTLSGHGPIEYSEPGVVVGAAVFLIGNGLLLAAAAQRIRQLRFAPDRRAGIRLPLVLRGRIDTAGCAVLDLSLSGARVVTAGGAPPLGATVPFSVRIGDVDVELTTIVRRHEAGDRTELGLEFPDGQRAALARLAVALLGSEVAEGEGERSPARADRPAGRAFLPRTAA
jgi:cellulose synthase (UDP-forming)